MGRQKVLAAVLGVCLAAPAGAQSASEKENVCKAQGELMGVIQQARLDNVKKANLKAAVSEARPDFSEKVLATVPAVGSFVYDMRKRDLRNINLADVAQQQCLDNWDQIQKIGSGS